MEVGQRESNQLAPLTRRCIVFKRFVVATFLSALAVVGVAPAANAAATGHHASFSSHSNIDWD